MAEMHKPSGRHAPEQTYPSESGVLHPEAPRTEPAQGARANAPETFETNASDLEHRVEDRPDLGHTTGGRAMAPGEGEAYARAPSMASSPARQARARGDEVRADPSIRNENALVARARDEYPDESIGQQWEWGDEERMPGDIGYGAVPFAALALLGAGIAVGTGAAMLLKRRGWR